MGTDINVVLSHKARFHPPPKLPKVMQEKIPHTIPFIHPKWSWEKEYNNEKYFRCVINDRGYGVWLGKKMGMISTGIGWDQVAVNMELKNKVTTAVLAIGRFFESAEVIFLP